MYLLECTVCGVQLILTRQMLCICWNVLFVVFNMLVAPARLLGLGLTITRCAVVSLIWGASVPQVEFFRHFTEEGHRGFLKDISVKIIDRLMGGNRMRVSFWQYRLDCFAPKGLNTRQVDT